MRTPNAMKIGNKLDPSRTLHKKHLTTLRLTLSNAENHQTVHFSVIWIRFLPIQFQIQSKINFEIPKHFSILKWSHLKISWNFYFHSSINCVSYPCGTDCQVSMQWKSNLKSSIIIISQICPFLSVKVACLKVATRWFNRK